MSAITVNNLSDIGPRGLVISVGDEFFYVTEDAWRAGCALNGSAAAATASRGAALDVKSLVDLNVAVAKLSQTVLLNLDALADLDPGANPGGATPTRAPTPAELEQPAVLLHEDSRFYLVPKTMWAKLPEDAEGDAGVLVKRGSVVAAVPPNEIPSGTFCVLVNWNGLAPE